jgi:hypothetical protein
MTKLTLIALAASSLYAFPSMADIIPLRSEESSNGVVRQIVGPCLLTLPSSAGTAEKIEKNIKENFKLVGIIKPSEGDSLKGNSCIYTFVRQ